MRKALLIFGFFLASPLQAATIYVAQASAGGNTGANCANARAVSSLAAGDWVAGNAIHLCGTITSTISAQGNGSVGNVINVIFETGAKIAPSNCGTGCLNFIGNSFITVDGSPTSTPCGYVNQIDVACNGTIQATGNGTAGTAVQSNAIGMYSGGHDIEVRNLNLIDMYLRTSPTDTSLGTNYNFAYAIHGNGTNIHIHNNIFHDNYAAFVGETGTTSLEFDHNQIYNSNWTVFLSGQTVANDITNCLLHDNDAHDWANWDDTVSNNYHHDGFFVASVSQGGASHVSIYNNYMHGSWTNCPSSCMSALIYVNFSNNQLIYNNLIVAPSGALGFHGHIWVWNEQNDQIYNNTIICNNASNTPGVYFQDTGSSNTFTNNIVQGPCAQFVWTDSTGNLSGITNNVYQNSSLTGGWRLGAGNFYNSLAAWATALGGGSKESGSQALTTSLNLSGTYIPQAGSPVIAAGSNLTSLAITALNSDMNGNARPPVAAWDVGAQNSSNVVSSSSKGFIGIW